MNDHIHVQVFADDCSSNPVVKELLTAGTFLSSQLRAQCTFSTACSCPSTTPHILVNGQDLGNLDLAGLIDYLHFYVMGFYQVA